MMMIYQLTATDGFHTVTETGPDLEALVRQADAMSSYFTTVEVRDTSGTLFFTTDPTERLSAAKRLANTWLWHRLENFGQKVLSAYPTAEVQSFYAVEQAAKALLANTASAADLALLQFEIDLTGETLEALATRVVERAALFRQIARTIAGLRRKTQAAIAAATTEEQLLTVSDEVEQAVAVLGELLGA